MSDLVTGEAVALDLRTAALPSRSVAAALDAAAQIALLVVIGLLAAIGSVDVSGALGDALRPPLAEARDDFADEHLDLEHRFVLRAAHPEHAVGWRRQTARLNPLLEQALRIP